VNDSNRPDAPDQRARSVAVTPAGVVATLLLALVVAACVRLGFWQLARLDERRALNAGIAARLDLPPVADVAAIADTTGLSYRTAVVHGTFDDERHVILPGIRPPGDA
jgi:surfeit locus 1 family protein